MLWWLTMYLLIGSAITLTWVIINEGEFTDGGPVHRARILVITVVLWPVFLAAQAILWAERQGRRDRD